MRNPPEPLVVVWRNHIAHRCTLIYWGRKWKRVRADRWTSLRRVHTWSAHSPVNGGDVLAIRTPPVGGPHAVRLYDADCRVIPLTTPNDNPEYSLKDWPLP